MLYPVNVTKPTSESSPELKTVNLTKTNTTVSLKKKENTSFGKIVINLNWSQEKSSPVQEATGFFKSLFAPASKPQSGVDLDLGCLWQHTSGKTGCVQALGNDFGSYDAAPFIQLSQDDRTGAISEGEFLFLNGDKWKHFKRILIYAFIYEGVPDWSKADGVVTVTAPDQPGIEVKLDESTPGLNMCAIAMLENVDGHIKATRLAQYFSGHSQLDKAYKWGLRWQAGSKD